MIICVFVEYCKPVTRGGESPAGFLLPPTAAHLSPLACLHFTSYTLLHFRQTLRVAPQMTLFPPVLPLLMKASAEKAAFKAYFLGLRNKESLL